MLNLKHGETKGWKILTKNVYCGHLEKLAMVVITTAYVLVVLEESRKAGRFRFYRHLSFISCKHFKFVPV